MSAVDQSGLCCVVWRSGKFTFGRLAMFAGSILAVWLVISPAALAEGIAGRIEARAERGFGRMVFTFPEPVRMAARVTGGVLVVTFDRVVNLSPDSVTAKLPDYISAVRVDPDLRSLRFALVQEVRADLKDAAEAMYLDLMPKSWRGAAPPLPPEVAAELARRARAIKEVLAETAREQARPPPPMLEAAIAESDTRRRIVFRLPEGVSATLETERDVATVRFAGALTIDQARLKSSLAISVTDVTVEGQNVRFRAADAVAIEGEAEQGAFIVDLLKPQARASIELPNAPASPPVAAPQQTERVPEAPKTKALETLKIRLAVKGERTIVEAQPAVPLAVFERGGALWLVARGTRAVLAPPLDAEHRANISDIDGQQNDGWSAVRIGLVRPGLVAIKAGAEGWTILHGPDVAGEAQAVRFQRGSGTDGRRRLQAVIPDALDAVTIDDPDSGERFQVVPMTAPVRIVPQRQRYAEFELLRTAHGAALLPFAEDVRFTAGLDRVLVERPQGLALSDDGIDVTGSRAVGEGLINATQWNADRHGSIRDAGQGLLRAAAEAPRRGRTPARLRLAEFYLANGMAEEARGVLAAIGRDDTIAAGSRELAFLNGLAAAIRGMVDQASKYLSHPGLMMEPDAMLWRAYLDTRQRRHGPALAGFRQSLAALERMPDALQAMLRPAIIDAALAGGDTYLAGQQLGEIERMDGSYRDAGSTALIAGRIAEAGMNLQEALTAFRIAAASADRRVEAEGRLASVLTRLQLGDIAPEAASGELETIGMIWRGGEIEVKARAQLADLMVRDGQWRNAFAQVRRAVEIMPDHPTTRAMQAEASRRFTALFLEGQSVNLDRVQALAIFDEYRWLIPPGTDGDQIVTQLAERLYDLDLIDQAAELLDHQVTHRLKGQQRARVASRLALMQLVNHKPQQALTALRQSRIATLPDDLKRLRLLIEARALNDLSRGDLAMELLASETGADVERMRGDIHWRAKRWQEAAETYERSLGNRWQEQAALSDGERADVLRAGIGFVLAGDKLGTDRLRGKYLPLMADSGDAAAFKLVTLEHLSRPDAFRDLARRTVSAESIGAFLEAYRKRYPENASGVPRSTPKT